MLQIYIYPEGYTKEDCTPRDAKKCTWDYVNEDGETVPAPPCYSTPRSLDGKLNYKETKLDLEEATALKDRLVLRSTEIHHTKYTGEVE